VRNTIFAMIAIILCSCGPIQRAQNAAVAKERMAAARAEMDACVARKRSGEFKTYVEAAVCANNAQRQAFIELGNPNMDLHYSLSAARIRISEQLDAHQITPAEWSARLLEKISEVQNEARRRQEENALRNAAIRTMDAATTSAYVNMIGAGVGMMRGR
jgi:hypothetical protein